MTTRIDLPDNIRKSVAALLNKRLADAVVLASHAKQAHWNLRGPDFIALHELFDRVADMARAHADTLAERVTALGEEALGTAELAVRNTGLDAYPAGRITQADHLKAIADRLGAFANALRAGIGEAEQAGDLVSADILTSLAGEADKMLWMVESHLG
ncbi:MAG: DNA starvation/stationary phase protection protein [Rhodothalassiaceae bacterium]|nr:MAG: DNA starvation/stationary phase protection protein [Rhodothalassiaceae bacterium]